MDEGRTKALLALCWLWVVIVGGYMIWGAIGHAGLYRWLAELQVDQWGSYSEKGTALVPGLLLTGPAFWFIRRRIAIVRAREGSGPGVEARRMGRSARNTALVGALAAIVGGGAFFLSQGLPDGSEKATPLDAARLGAGPVPEVKVKIAGRVDPDASIGVPGTGGARDRVVFYAGFRPDGTAKDAPLRLFVERDSDAREALTTVQAFLPEQIGYLVEDGVPAPALRALEARGVRAASPHFLLKTGDLARREPYYITAAVSGLVALACLVVALIGALQARGRGRLAEALEAQRAAQARGQR
jgi:hypothetical protein